MYQTESKTANQLPKLEDLKRHRYHFGSCYDEMIKRELESFVPKHKSYIKESDLHPKEPLSFEKKQEMRQRNLKKDAVEMLSDVVIADLKALQKNVEKTNAQRARVER